MAGGSCREKRSPTTGQVQWGFEDSENMMAHHELHPLCTLFPRLTGAEFEALKADIASNGLRQPIVLLDGMILDGGNRYRACIEAGVEPTFFDYAGGNIVSFVLSANLHRRHMTAGQQAAIVASAQDWAKAQAVGKPKSGNVTGLATVAERAAQSGASDKTQRMADKVAKKSPELAKQVAHGEISLPKAVAKVDGKKKPKQKPAKPALVVVPPPADDHDGPDLAELVDELQAENTRLLALLAVAEADDLVAEATKWRSCYDNAVRQQSEAMDRVRGAEKREAWNKKQLMRCGKAVGEDDPTKIAATVEALARQRRAA